MSLPPEPPTGPPSEPPPGRPPGGQPGGQPGGPPTGPPGGPPGPGWGPGYGPGWGPGYGGPVVRPTNGKAIASLATGVASLVLSWFFGFGLVGIVAIVLGVKARNEISSSGGTQQGDGLALGGIITGAVAVVLALLILVVIGLAIIAGARLDTGPPLSPGVLG